MKIDLPNPKKIILQEEVSQIIESIEIVSIVDAPSEKRVFAKYNIGKNGFIIDLWIGDSYDAIGDWTQEQAIDKIKSLFS